MISERGILHIDFLHFLSFLHLVIVIIYRFESASMGARSSFEQLIYLGTIFSINKVYDVYVSLFFASFIIYNKVIN